MTEDSKNMRGVFYEQQDYAGLWRRILAWAVDLAFMLFILGGYCYLNFYFFNDQIMAFKVSFFGSLLIAYIYLAFLKSSKLKTLGFRVADVKIVDLYGNKPSWSTMSTRFMLLAIGPFSLIIDLLWVTGEPTKQTLRDKYIGTYVVRNSSEPKGTGKLQNVSLDFIGWHLVFKELVLDNNVQE